MTRSHGLINRLLAINLTGRNVSSAIMYCSVPTKQVDKQKKLKLSISETKTLDSDKI